ncbi:putative methyltransferase [Helianthus annuus]|uniref:protein arginine N-methyltransferase PRMT10-like n=1 Tax=Helianthus annuus TaxID=4232 RepID=UPI001652EFB1|nr:protein arginine N-methyltransferase PRMT10-like [Helianthus annuus]KAJ0512849.1 putative methyltransferase [Helianthus annuus]KAJ0528972.1 putative methyltransferase [Helianthus annuus]KAJ0695889.1 putative methyltransferase [Helianthus annuus]
MVEYARELIKANNLQDIIEVIDGSIKDITLPEKVDVIISERLKPTGVMYPSHAHMWLAPIRTEIADQKLDDYEGCMNDWHGRILRSREWSLSFEKSSVNCFDFNIC